MMVKLHSRETIGHGTLMLTYSMLRVQPELDSQYVLIQSTDVYLMTTIQLFGIEMLYLLFSRSSQKLTRTQLTLLVSHMEESMFLNLLTNSTSTFKPMLVLKISFQISRDSWLEMESQTGNTTQCQLNLK
jgi:hypothetical protein